MANTEYIDLLDDVLPVLTADPSDPVTEAAARRVVTEFCAATWVWQHLPAPINVVANQAAYALTAPADADIAAVLAAEHDAIPLDPKTPAWLNESLPRWRTVAGTPRYFTQTETGQLVLAPVPGAGLPSGLTTVLALQPKKTATGAPDWLMTKYRYSLVDGVLARLMLMSDKPWTDLANGQDRRASYESAVANARADAVSALGGGVLRVTPQH